MREGDVSAAALSAFLRKTCPDTGLIQRLKIGYRPYICPFGAMLRWVGQGKRIVDIGCGAGQLMLMMHQYCQPQSLHGIEIDEGLVVLCREQAARQGIENMTAETYDGTHVPEKVREADVVTMVDVLHHIPPAQQQAYLTALCQSLRDGQRLLFKDIDAASPLVVFNKLHDAVLSGQIPHEASADTLRRWLESAGMRILHVERIRMLWYPHVLIVAEKGGKQG